MTDSPGVFAKQNMIARLIKLVVTLQFLQFCLVRYGGSFSAWFGNVDLFFVFIFFFCTFLYSADRYSINNDGNFT